MKKLNDQMLARKCKGPSCPPAEWKLNRQVARTLHKSVVWNFSKKIELMEQSVADGDWSHMLDDLLRVSSMATSMNHGVESVVVISGILNCADGAIRFHKRVFSLDSISIAMFALTLDVSGVSIMYPIVELVFRISLKMWL